MGRYALNKNKFLLAPEVEHLRKTIDRTIQTSQRDAFLILIGLETGARAQEILGIGLGDLDTHEKTVFIRGLKGGNDREMPLRPKVFRHLLALAQSSESGRVFEIGYHRLRQIWMEYRPVKKPFHCLRHTFAIELYKKHRDLRLVQVALGHRNIQNTIIYADYVFQTEELRRMLR